MTQSPPENTTTPLKCLTGALIAGTMSIGMYAMTSNIAITFATKPMVQKTIMANNIAAAVRTLLLGTTALATAIFSIITIGLVALAIQIALTKQKLAKP